MGSYCNLYVGGEEFSWKGIIPDVTGLLFASSDYVASPLEPEDGEGTRYFEHRFITDCGSAKRRLNQKGITLDFLKALHFWAFGFNLGEYKGALEYRCESYLEERLGERFRRKHLRAMMRHLLHRLRRLSKDEEFAHVLTLRRCQGTKKDYYARMESVTAEAKERKAPQEDEGHKVTFDRLAFSRHFLLDFIRTDPYDNRGQYPDDERTSGSFDLDTLYELAMSVFASGDQVPVEMEFTEIVEARGPFSRQEVLSFLEDLLRSLQTRAAHFHGAFSAISTGPQKATTDCRSVLQTVVRTAKEKGDLLEEFTGRLFNNEPGFTMHRKVRQSDQEIDIVVVNRVADPFWASLQSPFLLVECRNRRLKVQAKDIRDFEIKLMNSSALARIGLVVSMSGFTKECLTSSFRSCREGYRVLLVDKAQIMDRFHNHRSTREWIEHLLVEQL